MSKEEQQQPSEPTVEESLEELHAQGFISKVPCPECGEARWYATRAGVEYFNAHRKELQDEQFEAMASELSFEAGKN